MARSTFASLTSSWHVLALFVAGLWSAQQAPATHAAEATSALPRYRLEVGQELNYKGKSDFKYERGKFEHANEWTVWVVRKNDDGSNRVVIRSTQKMLRDGKEIGGSRPTLAYCDVFGDGRIISNPSLGFHLDPTGLFPRLPADRKEADAGWENIRDRDDGRSSFKMVSQPGTGAGELTFREDRTSPMDAIYLSSHSVTSTFDPKRGLVTKAQSDNTQGYGFKGKGTGTTELVSVERHDADWARQTWEQADRYFQAHQACEEKFEQAEKNEKDGKKLLEEGKAILTAAQKGVSWPILEDQLDQQLKNHDQMAKYATESAKRRAEVVGKPAEAFEAPDLKGKSHSLKEYQGKVVILDFWYRGCGWCIRAMPQVKQLAAEFKGAPVAVIGMNTDRDKTDATFVVDKMGLEYTTLNIDFDLPKKFGVQGFPTLVIIDQKGTVHDLHVGYSPTLQQEVGQIVRQLLAKK